MEAPDFWDNPEASQKMMKELKSMKDDMEIYAKSGKPDRRYGNSDRDGI